MKYYRMLKRAFTLSEVLVTLGIIGIVAALTIPQLIKGYQKKTTVIRLKSAYAQLSEAIKLSEVNNGSKEYWDYSLDSEKFYSIYLSGYLKTFDVSKHGLIDYNCLKGECWLGSYESASTPKLALINGVTLALANHAHSGSIIIYVDINGFKEPNIRGKDLFIFQINKRYGLVPYGFGTPPDGLSEDGKTAYFGIMDRETLLDSQYNDACTVKSTGNWCAALIMTDGWEIRDDYPW